VVSRLFKGELVGASSLKRPKKKVTDLVAPAPAATDDNEHGAAVIAPPDKCQEEVELVATAADESNDLSTSDEKFANYLESGTARARRSSRHAQLFLRRDRGHQSHDHHRSNCHRDSTEYSSYQRAPTG
jgi:hypothetical protein